MSSPNPLEQLLRLNSSLPQFDDQVSNILHGEGYRQFVKRISGTDAVRLIDFLDRALDVLNPAGSGFRRCLRELRNICGARTILPTSYTPPSQNLTVGDRPVASGGSGDVYEGTLNRSKVCVKRVRMYSSGGSEVATKTLYQEAIMWKRLNHKNIVPLLGITTAPLQLISEWMPGGNLTEHIGEHPNTNRLGLVCDIAEGLYYLHSRDIVHGDLKGPNILVNNAGRARITDFGLTTVTQNLDSIRSASDDHGHTARWTAPEILKEEGLHSKEADVFSFAMVMIEAFTGDVPFNNSLPAGAIVAIMNGVRPPRPTHPGFTSELWGLMQHCWNADPYSRPEVSEILRVLGITPPPINRIGSSSTLTTSRPTAQISSQQSDHNSPASPADYAGVVGIHESQGPGSYVPPQTTLQRLSSSAPHRRPSQQRGKWSGNTHRTQPRQNTDALEVSPGPPDPVVYDLDRLQRGQGNQPYGHTGGAGKSRTDLQKTLSSRNRPRRNVGGQGSRHDLTRIDADDDDEGRYWSEGRRENRGASRSALNVGDGYNRGGPSRNPSRPDPPTNASRDRLAGFGQSKTNLQNMGKSASRLDLAGTGGGPISRQPSKKDTSKMSDYAARNPSRQEFPTPHEYSETQEGQVDQADAHTGGVSKPRDDMQSAAGNRNRTGGGPPFGGPPSGQPPKKKRSGMNGSATGNVSDPRLGRAPQKEILLFLMILLILKDGFYSWNYVNTFMGLTSAAQIGNRTPLELVPFHAARR